MKCLSALLTCALLLLVARADSVYYHATSGPPDRFQSSTYVMRGGDIIEQFFFPNWGRVDVLDLSFEMQTGGRIDVIIREGGTNGPIIASQILEGPRTGEFGRRRVTFDPPLLLSGSTPQLLQLIPAPQAQPNDVIIYGWHHHGSVPNAQKARKNGHMLDWSLDYGLGALVPDILPPQREPAVYHEQAPPVALFPDAVIASPYFAGPCQILITISNRLFPGTIYVESTTNVSEYPVFTWRTDGTNYPFNATFHIRLDFDTTPADVQNVLRRVRFRNFSDEFFTRLEDLSITYSNNFGSSHATARLQTVGENDPPVAAFFIHRTTRFWPATNRYVLTSRAGQPATVHFDLSASRDADYGTDRVRLTHAQDPGWQSADNTAKTLRPGRHQFTLAASDEQFTNTLTREIEVITVARALQLWKRGVRLAVPDRRSRQSLLRPLAAAQKSNAHRHKAALFDHLHRFFVNLRDIDVSSISQDWGDNYYAIADAVYPSSATQ